jgi:hypothetical protein
MTLLIKLLFTNRFKISDLEKDYQQKLKEDLMKGYRLWMNLLEIIKYD